MSTTYIAAIVSILATVLPLLGINVGSDALTATLQTLIVIGTGLWVIKERYLKGGITKLGVRK